MILHKNYLPLKAILLLCLRLLLLLCKDGLVVIAKYVYTDIKLIAPITTAYTKNQKLHCKITCAPKINS